MEQRHFYCRRLRNNKKNIPRSLFLGTLIVTVIYILANLAYLALLPMHGTGASDIAGNGIMFASNDQ
jgi:APA family basic amino acid/polyamine antiporter